MVALCTHSCAGLAISASVQQGRVTVVLTEVHLWYWFWLCRALRLTSRTDSCARGSLPLHCVAGGTVGGRWEGRGG